MPSLPAPLSDFIDDELMRAPLLVDQTIEAALDAVRKAMPAQQPHARALAADTLQAVLANRQRMLDGYMRSLRRQLEQHQPAQAAAPAPAKLALSLVDEDEVAADVALSRSIEAIRSTAEYELRELQTYTAALVGDMDVSRDHNPFRPEVHARALWAAAQALPLSRGHQIAFMRNAADAHAQLLRKGYAGAASRLEDAGIEPGAHRTLILPAGSRRPRPSSTAALRPGAVIDAESIDLLQRLYATLLADPLLTPDVRALLARLQPALMRAAQRDPQGLDRDSHPAWRFADRIAFIGETLPPPDAADRIQALRLVQGLIDHVAGEPDQTAAIHEWALERLARQERNRFEGRCTAALAEIAQLQALEDKLVASTTPPSTLHGTLDVSQLDTVPSQLLTLEPAPKAAPSAALDWLRQRRPGDWLRVFLQGRWVLAQLLWPGERGEVYLLGDGASSDTWAVRRRALCMLHDEQLLLAAEPRSLLRTAARRVMRRMTTARAQSA